MSSCKIAREQWDIWRFSIKNYIEYFPAVKSCWGEGRGGQKRPAENKLKQSSRRPNDTTKVKWIQRRRRTKTEGKAKIVADAWEAELINFLGGLAILHQDDFEERDEFVLFSVLS